jgi:hypothetical protein
MRRLDCHGFSYIDVFLRTCDRETGSRVRRRSSHWWFGVRIRGEQVEKRERTGPRPRMQMLRPYFSTRYLWTLGDLKGLHGD